MNNPIQMLDLQTEYRLLKKDLDEAVQSVFDTADFINGSQVGAFAEEIATYLSCSYATPCASGTDALQIALMACGIGSGDEVITTPFTFAATAEAICLVGARPVFVDIDGDTFNLNPDLIEAAITNRTRAIIPVHLYGQPADMAEIMSIAQRYHLRVIEDAAQAIAARYGEKCAGTIGDLGCFSFYPSKNLSCYGDGGLVVTNDAELGKRVQAIVNHGVNEKGHYERVGLNSRLDTIQAAILLVKLNQLDAFTHKRQKIASQYSEGLKSIKALALPQTGLNRTHVFHQYTIQARLRDQLRNCLDAAKVPTRIYYPEPIYVQKAYRQFTPLSGGCLRVEKACSEVLSLPLHPHLKEEQVHHIIESIERFFR